MGNAYIFVDKCICVHVYTYQLTFWTAIDGPSAVALTWFTHVLGPQECTHLPVEQTPTPFTVPAFKTQREWVCL